MRFVTAWLALALAAAALPAQDVFLGGRLDVELLAGDDVEAQFGRWAGVDATFVKPGVVHAYFDLSLAGGEARVQEFYAELPQTAEVVRTRLGRFLLPFGDPETDVADRYVAGGRNLYLTYDDWRPGNVYLDTDVTGLWLQRALGPVTLDAVGAWTPGSDEPAFGARANAMLGPARVGASAFFGTDVAGGGLTHAALHTGYDGARWDGYLQGFVGRASGGDFRGWLARVGWRAAPLPLELYVAQTGFDDESLRQVTATRFGAQYRFDDVYRAELRYELLDAAAFNNRVVARFLAVF